MNAPAPAATIDQLKELPLPVSPFSYAPQTWGWWVLLAIALAAALAYAVLAWRRWQRERYRREALQRLNQLDVALAIPEQRLQALRELPELLKRVALSMPDAPPVHSLSGSHWQAFLQQRARFALPEQFAERLQTLAYAPDARVQSLGAEELSTLVHTCRRWIEAHHVAV
ncbi:DUF4381 domain-containing protein [Pseudomonas sp. SWRI59]|uniref:DUF4381 domain-containing protein n=1 Tax=Pseudomonas TaxID=286 RepID=UPI0016449DBB|nr:MULTISPECIES: DUF4381 domain-containing protein [unclassified Pseudomonas]MBC3480898.1 DUF4381 domain-containing protein [Pseudomonas sp. SWRI77]MBC3504756.1 DUF4381 domain-containing protein [Pseudomonas sp. SWRI59]MBC3508138.1 DUF4381 domain-containing protein [Pseudomonas sp. SWRI68]UVL01715.1 DUF4381 domain-containing protein [Pseudomonas sp. B21-047]